MVEQGFVFIFGIRALYCLSFNLNQISLSGYGVWEISTPYPN